MVATSSMRTSRVCSSIYPLSSVATVTVHGRMAPHDTVHPAASSKLEVRITKQCSNYFSSALEIKNFTCELKTKSCRRFGSWLPFVLFPHCHTKQLGSSLVDVDFTPRWQRWPPGDLGSREESTGCFGEIYPFAFGPQLVWLAFTISEILLYRYTCALLKWLF